MQIGWLFLSLVRCAGILQYQPKTMPFPLHIPPNRST